MSRLARTFAAVALVTALAACDSSKLLGPDAAALDFVTAGVITLLIGSTTFLLTRVKSRDLRARDGFLLVATTWVVLASVASLPFYLHLPISYTHAFFEAISGLTTTGATVLTGLDDMPRSILFWRSMLQWLGGMGILILAVAAANARVLNPGAPLSVYTGLRYSF